MQPKSLRRRIYELVDVPSNEEGKRRYDWFDISLATLIVLNVVAVMVETIDAVNARAARVLAGFEVFSVTVFSLEYVLRLWSCTADPRYAHPVRGRIRFALRPLAVIDLLAILPGLLPHVGLDLRFLRVMRLFRILRVLKLGRYSTAANVLLAVLRNRRADLTVMLAALVMLLVVSSSLMYYAEHEAQPEHFSSIPAAMWWAVITLTTIGYGDVYPITAVGRMLGGVIAIFGIGFVALPTAVIAAEFAEALRRKRRRRLRRRIVRCPHCNQNLAMDARGRLCNRGDHAAAITLD